MTWQNEPKIETDEQAGIIVLRVQGDMILDMPSQWRNSIIDQLDEQQEHACLVINLAAVDRLGSWGEKLIKHFVSGVVGAGGRVAVVIDPHRSAMYAGLRVELGSIDTVVPVVETQESALDTLQVDQ